jgi:hypothetical protein
MKSNFLLSKTKERGVVLFYICELLLSWLQKKSSNISFQISCLFPHLTYCAMLLWLK